MLHVDEVQMTAIPGTDKLLSKCQSGPREAQTAPAVASSGIEQHRIGPAFWNGLAGTLNSREARLDFQANLDMDSQRRVMARQPPHCEQNKTKGSTNNANNKGAVREVGSLTGCWLLGLELF